VAPRGHRFEQCEVVRLRELAGENLLFRTNCEMGDFLLQSCRESGFEPRIIYRSGREDWVQAMVAFGCGVTVMPEFTRTHPATAARPLADPDLVRRLSLVTVAGRRHEPAVAALIGAMRRGSAECVESLAPIGCELVRSGARGSACGSSVRPERA